MEILTGTSTSPAAEHLYAIIEVNYQKEIDEKQATEFHHAVAQLLFLCQRVQNDIPTVVSFLTTIVRIPDEDDWGKLKRVLRYGW